MTSDQTNAMIDAIIKAIPSIMAMFAAILAWWQSRRAVEVGKTNTSKLIEVHDEVKTVKNEVNHLTEQRVQTETDKGDLRAQIASAEGHTAGVNEERARVAAVAEGIAAKEKEKSL